MSRWKIGLFLAAASMPLASCDQVTTLPGPANRGPADTSQADKPEQSAPKEPVTASQPRTAAKIPTTSADPKSARQEALLGVWTQERTGIRWLRFRPDGTGTMHIESDWIAATVIGKSLTMQIEWQLDGDVATMTSVSGTPAKSFERVSEMYGKKRVRTIVELTDRKILFRDESEDALSTWTRVEPGAPLPKAVASDR